MKNAINWFEIPVKKIYRAQNFYEILGAKMSPTEAME
jgi:predicted enzyme related to lactoylglutathione lyase